MYGSPVVKVDWIANISKATITCHTEGINTERDERLKAIKTLLADGGGGGGGQDAIKCRQKDGWERKQYGNW